MKRIFAVILTAVMVVSLFVPFGTHAVETVEGLYDSTLQFKDVVSSAWYKVYIDYAFSFKILNGVSEELMKPDANITRAQFVQILANIDGVNTKNTNVSTSFTDVPAGKWYSPAIKWANDNGIVDGVSEFTFSPEAFLTREQMCKMLISYTEYKNIILSPMHTNQRFADDADIAYWAYDYVVSCQVSGFVEGTDGNFLPKKFATRAQVAAIMSRFHKAYIYDGTIPKLDDNCSAYIKYDYYANPLINSPGDENTEVLPSFDILNDGFVKSGVTDRDLISKTLKFYTPEQSLWDYKDRYGNTITELRWISKLKDELGLTVITTPTFDEYLVSKPLVSMNSDKQCDLIYSNDVTWPSVLTLSKDISDLVSYNESPGVCTKTANILMWGNKYRAIAPIGEANLLWYNQSLTSRLGLSDPHTLWQNDNWNWNSFKSFILSIPQSNDNHDSLSALALNHGDIAFVWPLTNGTAVIENHRNSSIPTVINNWNNESVVKAWEFIAGTIGRVRHQTTDNSNMGAYWNMYIDRTVMSSTHGYTFFDHDIFSYTDYHNMNVKISWVPFPESGTSSGKSVAPFYGRALFLPKTTAYPENENVALKFAELWACRATEAIFDRYGSYEYFDFTDTQKKELFDFVVKEPVFFLSMNYFHGSTIYSETKFFEAVSGNYQYNIRTEAEKARNIVSNYILEQMNYSG